jgi:hypothetical protein
MLHLLKKRFVILRTTIATVKLTKDNSMPATVVDLYQQNSATAMTMTATGLLMKDSLGSVKRLVSVVLRPVLLDVGGLAPQEDQRRKSATVSTTTAMGYRMTV